MKPVLTSPDIHAWILANGNYLKGAYVKKTNSKDDSLILKLHKKEEGNRDLVLDPSGWIYFMDIEGELSQMAKYFRQELDNLRIEKIEQLNFDRIIRIDFSFEKSLILEMFGGGNIIFLKNNVIDFALKYREWKSKSNEDKTRSIKKGEIYKSPQPPINPFSMDIDTFKKLMNQNEQVVKILALKLNLSHYAEYICNITGIEKSSQGNKIPDEKLNEIFLKIKEFLNSINGKGYLCNGELRCININNCDEFENINDAIMKIAFKEENETEEDRILREQMKTLEEYSKIMDEYKKIGDEILMHLNEYNEVIEKIKKRQNPPEMVSLKETEAVIKLPNSDMEIKFNITKKPSEMAQYYYEYSKKLSKKIEGIQKVIGKKKKVEKKKETLQRKRFWFEKFRWFISSENALVIAGRDAKTNEEVVKKYMGERDYYVHADIHGAPSVVVKNSNITEKTLIEAGIFGLAYSKAWNAGYSAGDAYWVTFSQVSKMAESGEYVPRGAWIIRGKRNYIRNLPIRIAMGFIKYENTDILMAGPVDAVSSKTNNYVVIIPSESSKTDLAKKLSEKFNYPVDEIMKLLPPGPGEIADEKQSQ
ncbi:MAG: ribosome rescue protein RqcH [Thermoplasmata archaeon]|nr:ribosome rescue protein RqcH [Thermoplasmata archaeon]